MPTLKIYISNILIIEQEVSFSGLDTIEERQAHVDGLVTWLRRTLPVGISERPVIVLEGIKSKANTLIMAEELHERVKQVAAYKPFKNIKKKEPVKEVEVKPVERVKGEYSNKKWLEE
jgi:hypothetical protein